MCAPTLKTLCTRFRSNVFIACVGLLCRNTHPLTNHKHSPTAALFMLTHPIPKLSSIKLELTQYFANFLITHLSLSGVKNDPCNNFLGNSEKVGFCCVFFSRIFRSFQRSREKLINRAAKEIEG